MLRNRLGVFIGAFLVAIVGVQSLAEAARVDMTAGGRGIVIWDGGKDVSSMNVTGKSDLGDMTFADASQLVVDFTTVGFDPPANLFPRVFLIVSGAPGAGTKTLEQVLCPGAAAGYENYCDDLKNAIDNTALDVDPLLGLDALDLATRTAFIETELRFSFGAFLTPDNLANPTQFTIQNQADRDAFNAIAAGINGTSVRVGLITFLNRSVDTTTDPPESVQFTTRKTDGTTTEVPEPASLALLGTGLATLIARKRVRRG